MLIFLMKIIFHFDIVPNVLQDDLIMSQRLVGITCDHLFPDNNRLTIPRLVPNRL